MRERRRGERRIRDDTLARLSLVDIARGLDFGCLDDWPVTTNNIRGLAWLVAHPLWPDGEVTPSPCAKNNSVA